jgi:hypothetical protein
MSKYVPVLLLAFFVSSLAGCGSGIIISGSVTYEEDGSPVTNGVVNFDSENKHYSGGLSNGKYTLGGTKDVQRIPYGKYKVWLSGTNIVNVNEDASGAQSSAQLTPLVTREFCSSQKTPLTFDIQPGSPKTFDIVVKKPVEKKK